MSKNKNCDGCCYNNNPQSQLNCNKVKCCYLKQYKKQYECVIGEDNVRQYII